MSDQIKCIKCNLAKAAEEYDARSVARSFYICRPCHKTMNKERMQRDPAARLLARVRMRHRRAGIPVTLTVKELRPLLAAEERSYLEMDLVSCCRARDEGPLSRENVKVFKIARLIQHAGGSDSDEVDGAVMRNDSIV